MSTRWPEWFGKALFQCELALADDARAPAMSGVTSWWRIIERGIKPQTGDHGEPWPHVVEQVDRGGAGIADADDASVRQP